MVAEKGGEASFKCSGLQLGAVRRHWMSSRMCGLSLAVQLFADFQEVRISRGVESRDVPKKKC